MMRIRLTFALPLLVLPSTFLGCAERRDPDADVVRIGAYSVVREALHDGLLPAFARLWTEKTGRRVHFEESYNASGAQARAIAAGFDADVAVLSHVGDMESLVKAGKVDATWADGPRRGIVTNSLVVIGLREGNPKQIRDWPDLARPGVKVLYPDPKTSGGARWNINAIYGSALTTIRDPAGNPDRQSARERLAGVQANVVNMDASGRQSMANFVERGIGDAVVSYENELLLQKKQGKPIPYVVPEATLLIESPAAVVESSVQRHGNREVVAAFLEFLHTKQAQRILVEYGFRPTDPDVAREVEADFPNPSRLFTIADLGGWSRVEEDLYGKDGIWTSLFKSAGRQQ
jgi:sulfate transport system substrate-binding protein